MPEGDRISLYVPNLFSMRLPLKCGRKTDDICVSLLDYLWPTIALSCRKKRLIERNGKFLHLKQWTCKGTLRQVFVCLRPRTSYHPPSLHTVDVYTVFLFTQGRGRRVEPERREEGQQFTKHGSKIPTHD